MEHKPGSKAHLRLPYRTIVFIGINVREIRDCQNPERFEPTKNISQQVLVAGKQHWSGLKSNEMVAQAGIQTQDLLISDPMLYQLCYTESTSPCPPLVKRPWVEACRRASKDSQFSSCSIFVTLALWW